MSSKAPLLLAASHYGGGLRNMRGVGRTVGWVQALLEALRLRPPLAAESCLKWRWRQPSALQECRWRAKHADWYVRVILRVTRTPEYKTVQGLLLVNFDTP